MRILRSRNRFNNWLTIRFVLLTLAICYFLYKGYKLSNRPIDDTASKPAWPKPVPKPKIFDRLQKDDRPNPPSKPIFKAKEQVGKEKAAFVMLVRNEELFDALGSIRQIEDRFNHKYKYPWVFLNDKPFTEEFKRYTTGIVSGKAFHGLVPDDVWEMPEYINTTKLEENIKIMVEKDILYGGSLSYRNMCRYQSGHFFEHELLDDFDWYWRVEPDTNFSCDVEYDPFEFMRMHDKVYGFTLCLPEYIETIPTLWQTAQQYFMENPQHVSADNSLYFLSENDEETDFTKASYNKCHFWSNFEIGSLNFFRSKKYKDYIAFLEQSGGFYYERWGDAPVHTIGVAMMSRIDQIHHFADFAYFHPPFGRCPMDEESHSSGRCLCDRNKNFDTDDYSCWSRWIKRHPLQKGHKGFEEQQLQLQHDAKIMHKKTQQF